MSNEPIVNEEDGTYSKKPDSVAYHVQESRDGKSYWNRVGVAWKHQDGNGATVKFESIPVDGWVTLRDLRDGRMQAYEDEQQDQARNQDQNERGSNRGRGRSR